MIPVCDLTLTHSLTQTDNTDDIVRYRLARKHKNSSIWLLLAKRVLVTGQKNIVRSEIKNYGVLATSYSL